jgi:hypothetical protein
MLIGTNPGNNSYQYLIPLGGDEREAEARPGYVVLGVVPCGPVGPCMIP